MQETFRNCYVSTAKTTTKFLESGEAYVFTGDIAAMWLRDSSAQVVHYLPYLKEYPILKEMVKGLIARQAKYDILIRMPMHLTKKTTETAGRKI